MEANGERYMAELFEGLSEADEQAVIQEFTERIRTSGHFPRMVAMLNEGIDPDAADTRDERFDFGLDCLLDGIAARLSRAAAQTPPAPADPPRAPLPGGLFPVAGAGRRAGRALVTPFGGPSRR